MQINLNTNNNTNFKALYLHKGCRLGKTYKYNDGIVEFATNSLKNLAKDVDIHIRYRNILENGFDITVSKIVNSPLKRFLWIIGGNTFRSIRPEDCPNNSVVDTLIRNAEGAKEDFFNELKKGVL